MLWIATPVALMAIAGAPFVQSEVAPRTAIESAVEVRVVGVDVVVLDRRGRPVTGLAASDFRLTEDGRPVEIAYFSGPAAAAEPAPSHDAEPRAGATSSPTARHASLAFLLDERLLHPAMRRRAVEGLQPFLAGPGAAFDRVVFARYRDDLELVEPVTPERIALALEERGPLATGASRALDLRRAIDGMVASHESCTTMGRFCRPCYDNWHELLDAARQYSWAEEVRVALAVDALAELVSWLSALEGEKLLVYPSESLPHRPGIEAFAYLIDLCGPRRDDTEHEVTTEMLQLDESRRFRDLGAWANARGVRLFPLDVAGLRPSLGSSVEFASADVRPSSRFDEVLRTNAQSGLHQIADETGGKAVLNSNRPLEDLDLRAEVEGSYSLGFVPSHAPSGRRHELRVELAGGRGRELRYRRSYFDRTLDQRLADDLQSVLWLGLERDALGASLAFGEVRAAAGEDGAFEVPVRLSLREDRILRLPAPASGGEPTATRGRLRVWLGARNADGDATELRQETFVLGAEGLRPVAGRYHFTVTLPLPAGRWTVAVGVRDEIALLRSLLRGVIEVGATAAAPPGAAR